MTRKPLCWLCILLMLLSLAAVSMAEGDDEEVSIAIFDADGNAVTDEPENGEAEPEAEPVDDIAKPVYQADGSILITLSFGGDMTIGRNVQSSGTSIFDKELKRQDNDPNFIFRNVKELLLADDMTMVNFEGTLTTADRNRDKLNNDFLFRADPSYGAILKPNGIDTVSLENNHVLDMGEDGFAETKQTLSDAGIPYASEDEPAILVIRGVTIGSLAYQTFDGRHDELIQKVPGDIQALRDKGCEVVIVSYHWGKERDYAPNANQVRLAHATVDAGADLVIGHHSHRINPIELYNGKYICYSLGNFSFAGNNKPDDMSTFIFQIKLRVKEGVVTNDQIRIVPCRISSKRDYNDFAITPYTKDENIEAVLRVLKQNGEGLDYVIDEYPLKWIGEE